LYFKTGFLTTGFSAFGLLTPVGVDFAAKQAPFKSIFP